MIQGVAALAGAMLVISAFLFALYNMGKSVDEDANFNNHFKKHLTAMAMMFLGAVLMMGSAISYALMFVPEQW
jgi:hypothetical protein